MSSRRWCRCCRRGEEGLSLWEYCFLLSGVWACGCCCFCACRLLGRCKFSRTQNSPHVLPLLLPPPSPVTSQDQACGAARRTAAAAAAALVSSVPPTFLAPLVVLLLVPSMGRMSDPLPDVRTAASRAFAALVPLLPLARGAQLPAGVPQAMRDRASADMDFLEQLLDNSKVADYPVPVPLLVPLRRYQQEGINWMAFLRRFGLSGALCDDMGLGKTLQSTALLVSTKHERAAAGLPPLPSLVVCPPTLVGHWEHEVAKYLPAEYPFRVVQYAGLPAERARLRPQLAAADLVVASYETVRSDSAVFEALSWAYVVLDEGHAIRNPKAKATQAVKRLSAAHRLVLSGTPIQNSVGELWSLFDFLMPGFLGTEREFRARYGGGGRRDTGELDVLAVGALHKQVMPFVLRRMKEDVLKDLPPKILTDIFVELSPLQRHLYAQFEASQTKHDIEAAVAAPGGTAGLAEGAGGGDGGGGGGGGGAAQHVFQALQYMRKLCSHPALALQGQPPEAVAQLASDLGGASAAADPGGWVHRVEHSPKLLALTQILRDCGIGPQGGGAGGAEGDGGAAGAASGDAAAAEEGLSGGGGGGGHRVLVFAQLKGMLDLVERDLFQGKGPMAGVSYLRLDGSVEATKRFDVARRFNADSSIEVLLLTTHVGGLGLNLTAADVVVFLEHDWNPQRDLQAMDRAHRLGQKRCVSVYRILTRATLEERIMSLQRFKLDLANAVVNVDNASLSSMDTGQLLELFTAEKGAKVAAAGADGAAAAGAGGAAAAPAAGMKALLAGLEELWDDSQYAEEFALDSFVSKLAGGGGGGAAP